MKRGQVAAFVILALIAVAIVIQYLAFRDRTVQRDQLGQIIETATIPPQLMPIKIGVESCIKDTLEESLLLVSLQGGRFVLQEPYFSTEGIATSYGSYQRRLTLPSLEKIEEELAIALETLLPLCVDALSFPAFSLINEGINTDITINNKGINANVRYPLTITRGNTTTLLNPHYEAAIQTDFKGMYATANHLAEQQTDFIKLTPLINSQYELNLLYTKENALVYLIHSKEGEELSYTFMFAVP